MEQLQKNKYEGTHHAKENNVYLFAQPLAVRGELPGPFTI